jgi:RNA polymerase sigma factor (sigma-70 family)
LLRGGKVISQTNYISVLNFQDPESDEGLVFACRRGEANAWSMLVNRYQRLIYAIPRRAGLDEDQVAEVFQRTFTKLFENLERINQPNRIQAWLVTTARRETLSLIHQQRREPALWDIDNHHGESRYEAMPDDAPLPDEALERLQEQHTIRTALESLGEPCCQLLKMLFYRADLLSYAEVAAALNMPEGSLGPTRARCLQKLRHLLEQSGF